jgi:hypothetical protein
MFDISIESSNKTIKGLCHYIVTDFLFNNLILLRYSKFFNFKKIWVITQKILNERS